MQRENVFPIDRFTRKGVDCLVEGVKCPDSPYYRTRMTVRGEGGVYRLEGSLTPLQALELFSVLPKAYHGLKGVEADIVMERIPIGGELEAAVGRPFLLNWSLAVTRCHPSSLVAEGKTYSAIHFGMAPAIGDPEMALDAEDKDEDEDDVARVPGR